MSKHKSKPGPVSPGPAENESQAPHPSGAQAPGNGSEGAGGPAPIAEAPEVAALRTELEQVQAEVAQHQERYLRAAAEVENTRRRAENDVSNARRFAIENFAAEILSVRDSLELARAIEVNQGDSAIVDKMKEGLDLTLKQLDAVFAKFGISTVDPAPGDRLDPERHQAMSMQDSDQIAPNHIVSVIQKGYLIHDRLLRPAMVIVARAASAENAEAGAGKP